MAVCIFASPQTPIFRQYSPDKCVVVHRHKKGRDELAVHPVRHPSMSRNDRVKVLDPVRALYRRGPEAAERGDDRRKRSHKQRVELDGSQGDAEKSFRQPEEEERLQEGPDALRLWFRYLPGTVIIFVGVRSG